MRQSLWCKYVRAWGNMVIIQMPQGNGRWEIMIFIFLFLFAIFILHLRESELYRYVLDGS